MLFLLSPYITSLACYSCVLHYPRDHQGHADAMVKAMKEIALLESQVSELRDALDKVSCLLKIELCMHQ